MNKTLFLSRLLGEREKFELLVNRVGFARRLTLKGVVGKWSVKDILAHVLAYEQFLADRMEEISRDEAYLPAATQNALDEFLERYGYPDFDSPLLDEDTPNAWVVEKYQNVPMEDVVTQELNAFAAIVSLLETLEESMIERHNLYDRIANNTYKHYREHSRDIRRWLAVNATNSKKS